MVGRIVELLRRMFPAQWPLNGNHHPTPRTTARTVLLEDRAERERQEQWALIREMRDQLAARQGKRE